MNTAIQQGKIVIVLDESIPAQTIADEKIQDVNFKLPFTEKNEAEGTLFEERRIISDVICNGIRVISSVPNMEPQKRMEFEARQLNQLKQVDGLPRKRDT